MATIHVYLEDGFDHDLVTISAGAVKRTEPDVSTRHQIGLAAVVDLELPDAASAVVRVAVPARGLAAEAAIEPSATPHVHVGVERGSLKVRGRAAPPRYA